MDFSNTKSVDFRTWLLPTFGAMLFLMIALHAIFSPNAMLGDPGIGWHLISGRYMLENFTILDHDIFSYTRPGEPWVTFEWLFQCLAAGIEKLGGLPLLTVVCALIYGSIPVLIYRRMMLEGVNIYFSIAFTVLTLMALTAHAHARPHIFTYLFFTLLLERLIRFDRGDTSSRTLWVFIPLMILWTNLHGGFVVAFLVVGIAFAVACVRAYLYRTAEDRNRARTYILLGLGMALVSLINPFGWNLHLSIIKSLTMKSIHMMQEFQSPDFNTDDLLIRFFEMAIITGIVALILKKDRLNWTEFFLFVFFMSQGFHARRHVFLFFIVAAPMLARELSMLLVKEGSLLDRRSKKLRAMLDQLKSSRVWIPASCLFLILLSQFSPHLFRSDLYGFHLSKETGAYIGNNKDKFQRMFNTVNIGGVLVFYFWPDLKIFADDRNDFYGDDFYMNDLMAIHQLRPTWQTVLDKYEVSSAVMSSHSPLAALFKASTDWRLVFEDDMNTIFLHRAAFEDKD